MIKEIGHRLLTGDPDLASSNAQSFLNETGSIRTHVLGHQHCAGYWSRNDRFALQTVCFRNEFLVSPDDRPHRLLAKVYAEVFLVGGRTVRPIYSFRPVRGSSGREVQSTR